MLYNEDQIREGETYTYADGAPVFVKSLIIKGDGETVVSMHLEFIKENIQAMYYNINKTLDHVSKPFIKRIVN